MKLSSLVAILIAVRGLCVGIPQSTGLEDPKVYYERAITLHQNGDLDAAIQQYSEVLRLKPDHLQAHRGLGVALAEKGDIDTSIREFREMVRINADSGEAHSMLGLALARRGDFKRGMAEVKRGLALEPDSADTHFALAILSASKGDLSAFMRELTAGGTLSSKHPISCAQENAPELPDSKVAKVTRRLYTSFKAEPEYPAVAKVFNLFGNVQLRAVIGADGKLRDVQVVAGHPLLVRFAVQVVSCWQYLPRSSSDVTPVEIELNFAPTGPGASAGRPTP